MKKISFLFALLCASVMSFATVYDDTELALDAGETVNQTITLSICKSGDNTTQVVAKSTTSVFTGVYECIWQQFGGGTNPVIGEFTVTDHEISFETTWDTYPTSATQLRFVARRNNTGGGSDIFGGTATSAEVTGECAGSGDAKTASELSINATEKTLDATNSETFQIEATTAQGYDGTVTYASSKDGIATVSASGLVTAAGRGTATITITAPETENFAASTKKLTVTVTGPINWDGVDWLAGSDNKYKVVVDPVIPAQFGGMSKQGDDLYIGFPSAAFGEMSIEPSAGEGAWKKFALSNFPAKENQFTVVCDNKTYTFDVYYADGTEGGESGGGESEGDIASEYCGEVMSSGNTEAAFTWETTPAGAIVISISETLGGADNATHFRGNGISLDKFKVGEGKEDASLYFTHSCGGSQKVTLTPIENQAPALGTKIYVNAVIEYATSKDGNAWPTLQFEYTYGGVCKIVPELTKIVVSAAATYAQIGESVAITAQGKDQMNENIDAEMEFSVTPADAGSIENGIFTFAKAGAATITATSGDVEGSVTIYGVPSANLALNQPCEGGYYDNNPAESFDKANDGDANTAWVTYADRPATEEWWYVDLGDKYTLAAVDVLWGEPASSSYILQVRDEAPTDEQKADDEAWETLLTVNEAGNNSEQFNVVIGAGRYVRLRSLTKTANFLRLKEVRVFGTEYVAGGDEEAPVMGSAALVSKTWNSAVIAVEATDNIGIAKYHVVDATNSIDKNIVPAEGKITITGLTPSTEYNLVITAIDASQNESANSKSVEFTTNNYITAPTAAAEAPTWDASWVKAIYSPTYSADCNFQDWGSGTVYSQDTYGKKYVLAGGGYFGVDGFKLNCLTMEKLHYDIWIADDATIRVVPIWGGAEQGITVSLKGQQWNSVDIALEQYTGITDWSNIYQMKIDQASNLTFWIGNAYFYRESELVDDEKPTNVTAATSLESYFSVKLTVSANDNSGAVLYVVKDGETEVGSGAGASGASVNITVNNLTPNTEYNLNVIAKDGNDNAAEPVAVSVKTKEAPASAPVPTFSGMEQVVPVFTDAEEGGPAIAFGAWGQTTVGTFAELAANDQVCYGSNFNYMGWLLTPAVDATDMEFLHVDFYSATLDNISVTPISPGHEGVKVVELTKNAWNCVEIDLSAYDGKGIVWSNIFQFKFFNAAPAGGDLFIDNVFFYTKAETPSSVENTESGNGQSAKVIENGVLYIVRDGVRYNIMGAKVK